MAEDEFQRFVLLNRFVSRSATRAPEAFKPPIVEGSELFTILEERNASGAAIEFFGATETERDADETDDERIARSAGHNFIWLREIKIVTKAAYKYANLLLEYVDQGKKSFSVVDTSSLKGRDITGAKNERGGVSCHVVVRLPIKQHDDGDYRCSIEVAHSINRGMIEAFIGRQLRRWAQANELTFEVHTPDKKGKMNVKEYRYNPRLELFADVGRSLTFATAGGRELSHVTFTKRSTKQSIGGKDHVLHQELIADVELKVSAKQGPDDPKARFAWLAGIRSFYETSGYRTKLTYRQLNGGIVVSGNIHQALAGATILSCVRRNSCL